MNHLATTQASLEYGGSILRNGLRWVTVAATDYWMYAVAATIGVVLLWKYLSK